MPLSSRVHRIDALIEMNKECTSKLFFSDLFIFQVILTTTMSIFT